VVEQSVLGKSKRPASTEAERIFLKKIKSHEGEGTQIHQWIKPLELSILKNAFCLNEGSGFGKEESRRLVLDVTNSIHEDDFEWEGCELRRVLREGEESLLKCVVAAYSDTLCFESLRRHRAPVVVLESKPAATQTPFNTLSIIEKSGSSHAKPRIRRGELEVGSERSASSFESFDRCN
jgi:hypothetical protein